MLHILFNFFPLGESSASVWHCHTVEAKPDWWLLSGMHLYQSATNDTPLPAAGMHPCPSPMTLGQCLWLVCGSPIARSARSMISLPFLPQWWDYGYLRQMSAFGVYNSRWFLCKCFLSGYDFWHAIFLLVFIWVFGKRTLLHSLPTSQNHSLKPAFDA